MSIMQAEIGGYFGKSVNLIAALDPDSGLVIVSKELTLGERVPGAPFVTNDRRFTEDRFSDAIRHYFRAISTGLLELTPAVPKHDPKHKIETDSMNENGARYRLHPDTSNGNVAVLAIMEASNLSRSATGTSQAAMEMRDMFLSIKIRARKTRCRQGKSRNDNSLIEFKELKWLPPS